MRDKGKLKERIVMEGKSFGIRELDRFRSEVGLKNRDVRLIKGVCAVMEVPVIVADEASKRVQHLKTLVSDARGEINLLKNSKRKTKIAYKSKIKSLNLSKKLAWFQRKMFKSLQKDSEQVLKKFS